MSDAADRLQAHVLLGKQDSPAGTRTIMDIKLLAGALLKRLLVSLAIFAVGFVLVCALFPVASADWLVRMLGALPSCGVLIFIVVSVIWLIAQRLRNSQHKTEEQSHRR